MRPRRQIVVSPGERKVADEPAATKYDWSAADALIEEEIVAGALADPDAQPLSDAVAADEATEP